MLNEQLPKQPRKLRRLNRQMNREIEFVSECVVELYLEGTSPTYTVTAKMPKSPFGIDEYLSRVGHTATTLINGG